MAHPVIDETGKARLPKPPPGLIALLKGSKHITAALVVFAVGSVVLLAALGTERFLGVSLSPEAWDAVSSYVTVLVPAALATVGASSLRHVGGADKGGEP